MSIRYAPTRPEQNILLIERKRCVNEAVLVLEDAADAECTSQRSIVVQLHDVRGSSAVHGAQMEMAPPVSRMSTVVTSGI